MSTYAEFARVVLIRLENPTIHESDVFFNKYKSLISSVCERKWRYRLLPFPYIHDNASLDINKVSIGPRNVFVQNTALTDYLANFSILFLFYKSLNI